MNRKLLSLSVFVLVLVFSTSVVVIPMILGRRSSRIVY